MNTQNQKQQVVYQQKCPNCGASLRYDPQSGNLACDHCNTTHDFDKSGTVEERDFTDMVTFSQWDDSQVCYYRCNNCGASTVLPRTALATTCPFCSSPVVVDENCTGLVRPDSLVPFELTQKQASAHLVKWQSNRFFAPGYFKKQCRAETIKGVFLPAWTFDADTTSSYEGRLGKRKTRTVRRNGKTYTETYVQWFSVNGTISNVFDDVFVRGNESVENRYFDRLHFFNQSKYVVYNDEYLAGYMADNYTVEPMDAYAIAKQEMNNQIRQAIMRKHNADVEGHLNVNTTENSRSFKYMMIPVYVSAIKYRNKVYNQYVSGVYKDKEKNKAVVCGKAPVSPFKVVLTILLIVAVLVGIVYLSSLQVGAEYDLWGAVSKAQTHVAQAERFLPNGKLPLGQLNCKTFTANDVLTLAKL